MTFPGGTDFSFERKSAFSAKTIELIAATGDPSTMPGTPAITSGRPYLHRTYIDQALPANSMTCDIISLTGTAPTVSNAFMGVYDAASGLLLAQTGDLSASITPLAAAGGIINAALTSQLAALPVNHEIYLAFLATLGGTAPVLSLIGGRQFGTNQTMTSDARLFTNSSGSSLTALPQALPALTQTAGFSQLFLGVGP